MAKTRKIPLITAVILTLLIAVMPILSLNAAARSLRNDYFNDLYKNINKDPFEGVRTKTSVYKVALLDADFHDSDDGCLNSSEEAKLLELMQETADKIQCNIGIAITSDLHRMSDESYVRKFHDEMYGEYSDSISLLLLNTHGNPSYTTYEDQIYNTDRAYDLFNKRLNKIFDRIYKAIDRDADDFYGACSNFCAALKSYGSGFGAFLSKFNISGTLIIAMLIFGSAVSIIVVKSFQSGYKKKKPISASHYIDKSRTRITRQVDQFVREYTTSVHLSSSSGGGRGGGGGGHRSGGGGGRHR